MKSIGQTRVAGLVCSGVVSAGVALVLLFKLVTPQAIAGLGTPELVGVLSLLVMPAAALWAVKRAAQPLSSVEPVSQPNAQPVLPPAAPARALPDAAPLRKAA